MARHFMTYIRNSLFLNSETVLGVFIYLSLKYCCTMATPKSS